MIKIYVVKSSLIHIISSLFSINYLVLPSPIANEVLPLSSFSPEACSLIEEFPGKQYYPGLYHLNLVSLFSINYYND
jgi:hypothetical protein